MIRMLNRVRIQTLRDAEHTLEEIAASVGVRKRSVQRILTEPTTKSPESAPTPASPGRRVIEYGRGLLWARGAHSQRGAVVAHR